MRVSPRRGDERLARAAAGACGRRRIRGRKTMTSDLGPRYGIKMVNLNNVLSPTAVLRPLCCARCTRKASIRHRGRMIRGARFSVFGPLKCNEPSRRRSSDSTTLSSPVARSRCRQRSASNSPRRAAQTHRLDEKWGRRCAGAYCPCRARETSRGCRAAIVPVRLRPRSA